MSITTSTEIAPGTEVEFDLFGGHYTGRVERFWTEPEDEETVHWARVRLPHDRVIGGVGPARDYVDVTPDILTERTPDAQIARFREAGRRYEDEVRSRIGASLYNETTAAIRRSYGGRLPNEQLADALAGLDLNPSEWHLMEWFLSWDSQDTLASIITKAREQGSEQGA